MIPYQELADALERWRIRTGLPARTSAPPPPPRPFVPSAPAVAAPAPSAPIAQVAPPAPPRAAPPAPPPGRSTVFGVPPPPAAAIAAAQQAQRAPTNLPAEELEPDVLDDDQVYDNEGGDFAVAFGGPPAAASGSIGHDDDGEHTGIAAAPGEAAEDPFAAETAAVRAEMWPEVAEAQHWTGDETNATAYGWGQNLRPPGEARRPGTDPDDDPEGSTVVGSTKPRG